MADFMYPDGDLKDFDAETYIKILIAIAKADKENGPREFDFIKKQGKHFGIDAEAIWDEIDKKFSFSRLKISRQTALAVLRDCITLASLDGSFTLSEKERTYTYAAKMNIPRREVEHLEKWVMDYQHLKESWKKILDGYLV